MTIAPRGKTGGAAEAVIELGLEDLLEDEDEDTGVLRVKYSKNMERLAATRVEIAKIKRNIPPPERP